MTTRPPLCPCPLYCTPLCNQLEGDRRLKTGDLDEGYSGGCIGKSKSHSYVVNGQVHENDLNCCIFSPIKGIILFRVCRKDLEIMREMINRVVKILALCLLMGSWASPMNESSPQQYPFSFDLRRGWYYPPSEPALWDDSDLRPNRGWIWHPSPPSDLRLKLEAWACDRCLA